MRFAETEPGSPVASARSAASSMFSRVALPRRLGRRCAVPGWLIALTLMAATSLWCFVAEPPVLLSQKALLFGTDVVSTDVERISEMAKPPLSMKPTGWFQVAWSDEIDKGAVHKMHYFGQEMVAWRAQSGRVTVMDAYCEHLGAHLGFGGHVEGEVIECAFHGWQWNHEGRNVCIPYENRPNRGRRMRTYPVVERNESVYIWHNTDGREPFFDAPDGFASLESGSSLADYYPRSTLYETGLELHPQYVLENGVDFAHFKFVH